jgi:TolB-like protein/tetratricopeptide (TPR) repeat protein
MANELQDTLQSSLGAAYALERELSGGGMSRVFVAREIALDRRVVIKVLPPELAADVNAERFRREIALAARLQHPHIVPLLTAGEINGLPYFSMPFIEGESLRTTLDRAGELPIATAVRYLREVASALAYAHANRVVHRDIKPDNVLISGGAAMVTDFGVAKAISAAALPQRGGQLTGLGIALGTPAYMAPEQAAADPSADARADLYAFGATAYELLTGQPPFSGRPVQALLAAHAVEIPEPVDRRRPAIPSGLATLVMRCLEKRPADRPQTATEVVQTLDSIPLTPTTTTSMSAYTGAIAAAPARPPHPLPRAVVAGLAVVGALAIVGATLAIARNRHGAHDGATRQIKVVVLPFTNDGPTNQAYFADGLTEAITNRLASLHNLGVIDPRSANQYRDTHDTPKQIGRELGVQYVLEGTVRWAPGPGGTQQVQISPTLVNASDETTKLAPGPYVVQPADVFQVQTDVATKVADALGVALEHGDEVALNKRVTRVPEAYDAYLRGRGLDKQMEANQSLSPTLLRTALDQYERAVTLDPHFALAFAELGGDRVLWSFLDLADRKRQPAAKAAIDSALALDPSLPEAHVARALYLRAFDHNEREAYDELVRAQAERPNDAELIGELGDAQVLTGRVDEGIANLNRAVQLDPRSADALAAAARTNLAYRNYDDAQRDVDRLMALSPHDWVPYSLAMEIAAEGHGDTAAARHMLERQRSAVPHFSVAMLQAEENTQGPSDWPHLESIALPDVHPEQVFDSVNFYLLKMDLYTREHRRPIAAAYADTALAIVNRHAFTGPFEPAIHQVNAVAGAVAGRRALAEQGIAAIKVDQKRLDNPSGTLAADLEQALAGAYVALNDQDSAIEALTQVLKLPSGKSPAYLRIDPEWDPVRSNPKFAQLAGQ